MAGNTDTNIQVLVLSNLDDVRSKLELAFYAERRYQATFTRTTQEALQKLAQEMPDIILVDDAIADGASIEAIRKLAIVAPSVPIVALADEQAVAYVQEALLAGARAFLTKPLHEGEIFTTLNHLVEMESIRRDSGARPGGAGSHGCQIITLMGLKGGVGNTTLAANLAVLLHQKRNARVVLLDGPPRLSDLEATLNLQAQYTYEDLLEHGNDIDAELVRGMLTPHTSGIHVLPGGRSLEEDERASAAHFEQVLTFLAIEADYLIIDNGSVISVHTEPALTLADHVLLLATPEITTLRRTAAFLRTVDESGFPREKLWLVVNRDGLEAGILADNISRHLNLPITARIPEDAKLVTYSINRGVPLVMSHPRSAVARQLGVLIDKISPEQPSHTDTERRGSVFGRLTTLFQGGAA